MCCAVNRRRLLGAWVTRLRCCQSLGAVLVFAAVAVTGAFPGGVRCVHKLQEHLGMDRCRGEGLPPRQPCLVVLS